MTDSIADNLKEVNKKYNKIRESLTEQAGTAVADIIMEDITKGIDDGKIGDVITELKQKFSNIDFAGSTWERYEMGRSLNFFRSIFFDSGFSA